MAVIRNEKRGVRIESHCIRQTRNAPKPVLEKVHVPIVISSLVSENRNMLCLINVHLHLNLVGQSTHFDFTGILEL